MIKLYIRRNKSGVDAAAEYDEDTGMITVLKKSRVSNLIAHTEKFRGARSIEKYRTKYVADGIVMENATFKSASTAANFVTGSSTNGLTAWKNEAGRTLKEILADKEALK